MKIRGIYKITNKINGKVYIGESLDIKRRWEEHVDELNNNQHKNYKLQNDWNTYDFKNFKFEILLTLDETISNFIDKYINIIFEDKYIIKYNSIDKGYNIERSLEKVLNKEKVIQDKNKDSKILKKYISKVKNGQIYVINNKIHIKNKEEMFLNIINNKIDNYKKFNNEILLEDFLKDVYIRPINFIKVLKDKNIIDENKKLKNNFNNIKSIKFVSIDKYGKEYTYYKIYIEYEWINNIKTMLNKYYDKYDFKLINEKEINKLIRKKD